jgi:hypothetical protein
VSLENLVCPYLFLFVPQHMGVKELQSVQVELDRAPGMRVEQIDKIVGQLLLGQIVDVMVEIGADAADRPRIGVDRLRLQSLEPQVLEMDLVEVLEVCLG